MKADWRRSEYTQQMIMDIKEEMDVLLRKWADGDFTHETSEGTAQKNAKAIGQYEALETVLNFIFETPTEEEQID
jgi:hypothetical protein